MAQAKTAAPAEAPKDNAPAEAPKDNAPAEAPKDNAPAEAPKDDTPVAAVAADAPKSAETTGAPAYARVLVDIRAVDGALIAAGSVIGGAAVAVQEHVDAGHADANAAAVDYALSAGGTVVQV